MGCATSKIDNEEVVSRCNTRKKHMRDAVSARHSFAAAFSEYVAALKLSGSAFGQYGEAQFREPPPSATPPSSVSTPYEAKPPKPPPLPTFLPTGTGADGTPQSAGPAAAPQVLDSLKRSVSMPPIPLSDLKKGSPKPPRKKKTPPPASPPPPPSTPPVEEQPPPAAPSETAPAEIPPRPRSPDEELVKRKKKGGGDEWVRPPPPPVPKNEPPPPPPPQGTSFFTHIFEGLSTQDIPPLHSTIEDLEEDRLGRKKKHEEVEAEEERRTRADKEAEAEVQRRLVQEEQERKAREALIRQKQQEQMLRRPSTVEEGEEEEEEEEEEVEEEDDEEVEEEAEEVVEVEEEEDEEGEEVEVDYEKDAKLKKAEKSPAPAPTPTPMPPPVVNLDLPKTDLAIVTSRGSQRSGLELGHVMRKIDDLFMQAYESGRDVSQKLEAQRVSFHKNFIEKSSDHKTKVLRAISWSQGTVNDSRSRYQPEHEEEETARPATHASTLDRLLAWEKKLLEEIKRAEAIRIDLEKKQRQLSREEARSTSANAESLERSKTAIQSLQTRYVVAIQGVDTARNAVLRLRDAELYPQLLELLEGFAEMWKKIHECHAEQQKLVDNMKKLELSDVVDSRNNFHKVATEQLMIALERWHRHFTAVVSTERDYMRQLDAYVQVSLLPLEMYDKSPMARPPIVKLCREWLMAMQRLPEKSFLDPIKNFEKAIEQVVDMQKEETRLWKRWHNYTKELEKKQVYVDNYEKKHLSSYSGANGGAATTSNMGGRSDTASEMEDKSDMSEIPSARNAVNPLTEKRAQLEVLRKRTEDAKKEAERKREDTRLRTMMNLETGLPAVFRTATHFSKLCSDAHQGIHEAAETSMLGN